MKKRVIFLIWLISTAGMFYMSFVVFKGLPDQLMFKISVVQLMAFIAGATARG